MPQPTTPKPKYSAAGEGNVYARANTATCKVTAADTDGTYEIFDEICKPGFESRLHMHVKSFQVCYVVDGSGEFQLGDEVFHAKKGACVNIPPGTPHKVGSKEGMRMLMVYSPPGLEGMMASLASDNLAIPGSCGALASIGTPRELTNGAPCLDVALGLAAAAWASISAIALLFA